MSNDVKDMIPQVTADQLAALEERIRQGMSEKDKLHLDQVEYRIRDHRERFTGSLLEVGRCLNEAKEAGLVPHGQWQDWVAAHTGFTVRGAQRVMRAAREVPKASALSLLDFGKVSALLSLPAEEREDFAREVDAEHSTLRQLEAAIRAKQEAEKLAEKLVEENRKAEEQLKADIYALECAQNRERQDKECALSRADALEKRLDYALNHPEVVEREVMPEDYQALKERDLAAAARIREAEDYADEQETRVRELQAQLDTARKKQTDRPDDAQHFISSCSTFFGDVCRYQNMDDRELLGGKSRADLETMRRWVGMILGWCSTMDVRLSIEQPDAEVDGYVR